MIQKEKPSGNFTPVSNGVFRDIRLNLTDRGLLTTLMSLPPDWDFSISGMAVILPDGKAKIRSSLKRLEKLGYVKLIQERNNDGTYRSNVLVINDLSCQPLSENRTTDNRMTGKPSSDNCTQYNNNNTRSKNTRIKDVADTLAPEDYEELVKEFGKETVDFQIEKIRNNHYSGCMNKVTIRAWCNERLKRKGNYRETPFNNFHQRTYSKEFYDELEEKLLGIPRDKGG